MCVPTALSMLFVVAIRFCNPACIRILGNDSAVPRVLRVLTLLTGLLPTFDFHPPLPRRLAPTMPWAPASQGFSLQGFGTNLQYATAEHAQLSPAQPGPAQHRESSLGEGTARSPRARGHTAVLLPGVFGPQSLLPFCSRLPESFGLA